MIYYFKRARCACTTLAGLFLFASSLVIAHAQLFPVASGTFEKDGIIPTSMVGIIPGICSGGNQSPQLSWSAGPAGTKSYAVVAADITNGEAVHWMVTDIPANVNELSAGQPPTLYTTHTNDFPGINGYAGMCPPNPQSGAVEHTYRFTVYALQQDLTTSTPTIGEINGASQGHYGFIEGKKTYSQINPSLTSTRFADGTVLPDSMLGNSAGVCNGANRSPSLSWNAWFTGTTHYAIVATETSVTPPRLLWSVVNIPATTLQVPENGPVPGHIIKAYEGICPPDDGLNHQYTFTLYALNAALGANATPAQIQAASQARVSLSGTKRFTPRGAGGTAVPALSTLAILSLSVLAGIVGLRYRRKLK